MSVPRPNVTWLIAAGLLLPIPATHAQWVEFANETATRLVCGDQEGANCNNATLQNGDEKDFAWGDVDMDGDLDLVSVNKQLGTTTGRRRNFLFLLEDGVYVDRTTQYASASTVTLQGGATSEGLLDLTNDRDVALVDVNGDEWLDIVTATTLSSSGGKAISHPRVYLNLGEDAGEWQGFVFDDEDRFPTMPAEPRFCSVSAGDLDGDGDQDIYMGDYQQGGARPVDLNDRLFMNDGDGYFTDESSLRMSTTMLESSFAMSTQIADMNNDGRLDIIKDDALNAPQGISISYNNAAGTPGQDGFFDEYEIPYAFTPYHVAVDDLNNDGLLDIVVTDDGSDYFMLNQGNGPDGLADFGPRQTLQGSSPNEFGGNSLVTDLNNDGLKDVIITNVDVDLPSCSQESHIFRNLGGTSGITLQDQGPLGIASSHLTGLHDAAAVDMNGDGWLDLVLGDCDGLWIYVNQPPTGIVFSYPTGFPSLMESGTGFAFQVQLAALGGGMPEPGSAKIFLSTNEGTFVGSSLTPLGGDLYEAALPAGSCLDEYDFYFTADLAGSGEEYRDPSTGEYAALVADGQELTFEDDFESDVSGWSVVNTDLLTGAWEQAEPNFTLDGTTLAAPDGDAEAGAEKIKAFVTDNGPPGGAETLNDVDGGPTDLISPLIDLEGQDAIVSYFLWFYCNNLDDEFVVSVTNDGDQPDPTWVNVETLTVNTNGWEGRSFTVSDEVAPTANVRVRFRVSDNPNTSITEGGVDLFRVESFLCVETCAEDLDSSGDVGFGDILQIIGAWGPCGVPCPEDLSGNNQVDFADILAVIAAWGPC
ncbi:MAG: hypothetical protein GY715_18910 [Planctomycetes bacterium]|nr:hypothetical protein [Planctomycetota bacterium]